MQAVSFSLVEHTSPSERTAIAWAVCNVCLAVAIWPQKPVPWFLLLVVGASPLVLFFAAEYIAARMHRGWLESLASDARSPQSPLVIKLLGWIALSVQTLFLLWNQ